jgi:hypothetical protein
VAIFRDMHYKGQINQNITEACEPTHIKHLIIITIIIIDGLKYTLKIKIQIKM